MVRTELRSYPARSVSFFPLFLCVYLSLFLSLSFLPFFSPPDIRQKQVKSRMIYTRTLRGAYSLSSSWYYTVYIRLIPARPTCPGSFVYYYSSRALARARGEVAENRFPVIRTLGREKPARERTGLRWKSNFRKYHFMIIQKVRRKFVDALTNVSCGKT